MNARERILGKLRAAAPDATPSRPDVAAYYAEGDRQVPPLLERVERFRANLTAVHAEVYTTSPGAWVDLAARLLKEKGVRRLLLDQDSDAGRALCASLPDGVETLGFDQPIEAWKDELFDTVDAGFTVAESGIAATGTLILKPNPRTPRTVSLVPPLHIALIDAATLHADLYRAARDERWADGMPTNLVLVSGPSKTSDIQQTVAYGAHGPKQLVVIVLLPDGEGSVA